jgi:hypothetical protein
MTEPFTYPAEPVLPPKRPKTALVLSLVAVVLALAGALTLGLSQSGGAAEEAGTFTVHGTMTVLCTSSYGSYSSSGCSAGYSDLHPGAQVELFNEKQEILATTELHTGTGSTTGTSGYSSLSTLRSYSFEIPGVPLGAKQYGVHIGNSNRGIVWATEAEATTTGFALSIGS